MTRVGSATMHQRRVDEVRRAAADAAPVVDRVRRRLVDAAAIDALHALDRLSPVEQVMLAHAEIAAS